MRSYAVTLRNEDGPFFIVYADGFEADRSSYTGKPTFLFFTLNGVRTCRVQFSLIYALEDVTSDEPNKIDLSTI